MSNNPEKRQQLEKLASNLSDILPIIDKFAEYRLVDHAEWDTIKDINDTLRSIARKVAEAILVCAVVERSREAQSHSREKAKWKGKS